MGIRQLIGIMQGGDNEMDEAQAQAWLQMCDWNADVAMNQIWSGMEAPRPVTHHHSIASHPLSCPSTMLRVPHTARL
jgi:hypothetical protein